jgi:hypothetical protein
MNCVDSKYGTGHSGAVPKEEGISLPNGAIIGVTRSRFAPKFSSLGLHGLFHHLGTWQFI